MGADQDGEGDGGGGHGGGGGGGMLLLLMMMMSMVVVVVVVMVVMMMVMMISTPSSDDAGAREPFAQVGASGSGAALRAAHAAVARARETGAPRRHLLYAAPSHS
jgi:flagellar basal body-associated protein FliL